MRLRVVAKGPAVTIKLEDRNTGELFAQCPVDAYPGVAVEAVMDSSRYFVLKLVDPSGRWYRHYILFYVLTLLINHSSTLKITTFLGRTAFIGVGFQDRADSFDLNVALQDHFR